MNALRYLGRRIRSAPANSRRARHRHQPRRQTLAVGLGLFCGIVPIWGYQMITAAVLAHRFRLNKAIALTASNISIPVIAPFLIAASLVLGTSPLRAGTPDDWQDSGS